MAKKITCNVCGEIGIKDDHDLYDCTENWEEENGIKRGKWLINWARNMQKKKKNAEPYQSDFSIWNQSVISHD